MVVLWILAFVLPYALSFPCAKNIHRGWQQINFDIVLLSPQYGFPDFGSDSSESFQMCTRKMFIYYTLFLITGIFSFISAPICKILLYLSSAFMIFLAIGAFSAVSSARRALASVDSDLHRNFSPIVSILRVPALYQASLTLLFIVLVGLLVSR